MTDLTQDAQVALSTYLQRVRLSLRGTSVDADEVERDVREHIEEALNGRSDPVPAADLSGVLERLGSPDQWVPDEGIPLWRRTIRRISAGPEDWRLAYASLGLAAVAAGLATAGQIALAVICFALAFFTARAATSLIPHWA